MAKLSICLAVGCGKEVYCRGLCSMHYTRLRRHGDVDQTANGHVLGWLNSAAAHEGDGCLIWPFARNDRGYGNLWIKGKYMHAHRVLCAIVNGPAPTLKHEAAHRCGNGHIGCVNPRHLSWKTKLENEADKFVHGTTLRGRKHPGAKLTDNQVREIRKIGLSVPLRETAERFGVSRSVVSVVIRREAWGWLE